MLIGCDESIIAKLGLQVHTKRFNTVAHTIRGLNSWQVLQKLWVYSHIRWLLVEVVFVWRGVVVIFFVSFDHALVVAQARFRLIVHHAVASHMWWTVLSCILLSGLSSACLDHSNILILIVTRIWYFAFNILIILVLTVHVWTLWRILLLWLQHRVILRWVLIVAATRIILKVIREPSAIGVLLLLLLVVAFIARKPWQLLLRLRSRHTRLHSWLNTWLYRRWDAGLNTRLLHLLAWTCIWSSSCEANLFRVVLVVLDCQFGLAGLDLIALLGHTLSWYVLALLVLFFLVCVRHLQMSCDEGACEFVLGNGRSQQLANSLT